MKLGPPEISIDGLNELAAFLVTLRKTRRNDASSRSSKKAEESDAKRKKPNTKPAFSGDTDSKSKAPVEACLEGLVEALADLLLEALGAVGSAKKGGVDEHQDHA